jgi:histidinol phosphatase-like enzyme
MMYLLSAPILIELITAFIVVLIARKYFKKISFKEIYEWFMMNLKKLKMKFV